MTDAPPAIEIRGMSKAFHGKPAVRHLTLAVPRGSIFGLLGHNGAGKSTSLGAVLGQVYPDTGEVRVNGHNVFTHRAQALSRVGAIFETPAFYDYLSGRRNLRIFCEFTGPALKSKLDQVIDFVGLTDRIDDKVAAYSHGMRQRLAVAQALLPDPDLLILDEPTDGLDPEGIHEMRELVRRLHRDMKMTIVFSSHLLNEVEQLCTHVAVLREGRLIFSDRLDAAGTDHRYVEIEVDRREEALNELQAAGLIDGHADVPGREHWLELRPDVEPAQLNAHLVRAGYAVSKFGPVRMSLEDFYLHRLRKHAPTANDPVPVEATA